MNSEIPRAELPKMTAVHINGRLYVEEPDVRKMVNAILGTNVKRNERIEELERELAKARERGSYWADLYQREGAEVVRLRESIGKAASSISNQLHARVANDPTLMASAMDDVARWYFISHYVDSLIRVGEAQWSCYYRHPAGHIGMAVASTQAAVLEVAMSEVEAHETRAKGQK